MTDWYASIFPPRRRAQAADPDTGSTIGDMVGREIAVEDSRRRNVVHPGTLREGPSTLSEQDFAQADAMTAFQRGVGPDLARLGRRMQYRPQIPGETGEQPGFPFPGISSEPPERATVRAARATGIPQRFLDTLIVQESGGDPDVKASTSSATGHAQFIDDTWLDMMRRHGRRYGLDLEAVPKADLLDLRTDPVWAALMAAEHARENALSLRASLGRDPTQGEVYLAHFAGVDAAVAMIRGAEQDGRREGGRRRSGTEFVSRAAAEANRNVFYANGRPRSVGEVIARQTGKFGNEPFLITDPGN